MFIVYSIFECKKKDNVGFKLRGFGNYDYFQILLIFVRKKILYKDREKY